MASIQGLSSNQLKDLYRNKIIVYLEGDDDITIYKNYWFRNIIDKVDFKLAKDGVVPIPGCYGVEMNVLSQRQAGVKAFGFIDRDAVQDFLHINETDDSKYILANSQRNQYVHYTVRWELENYLIDPEILEQERVNDKGKGIGRRETAIVAAELVQQCDLLKVHAAANIVLHQAKMKKVEDGFALNVNQRALYESAILAKYIPPSEIPFYSSCLADIEAFDLPGQSAEKRLASLVRRVHGKALFMRFFYMHKIQHEKKFSVADKLCARVPEELKNKLHSWVVDTL
jgi:hypothetical protein